jgi:hypothetical protein
MPNEPKTPEEYLSDALDLMVKSEMAQTVWPKCQGIQSGLD